MATSIINRSTPHAVALETTLLVHGVPKDAARPLAAELDSIITAHGARPATVGVVGGRGVVGLNSEELSLLLEAPAVPKANTGNLGLLLRSGSHAATTVSATMELAAGAGVRVFATGGIGGVHKNYGARWDVSADLAALTRFPVAVVASGVKNLLDVVATREMLETLGVPVIGFGSDRFPAFYRRESEAGVASTPPTSWPRSWTPNWPGPDGGCSSAIPSRPRTKSPRGDGTSGSCRPRRGRPKAARRAEPSHRPCFRPSTRSPTAQPCGPTWPWFVPMPPWRPAWPPGSLLGRPDQARRPCPGVIGHSAAFTKP